MDPLRRRGGVATPLVQAVDEDHEYFRADDAVDSGQKRIVVTFRPKVGAPKQTSGRLWLVPGTYAVVRLELEDLAPGFPLTHQSSVTEYREVESGLWLPEAARLTFTGSLLGFAFSSKSSLRLRDMQLRPPDVPARVQRALASDQPVLVWNEQENQLVVLRKKGRRPGPAATLDLSKRVDPDYLMKLSFGTGLEAEAEATQGERKTEPASGKTSPKNGRTELDRLSHELGSVELLRGGDPKSLNGWLAGFGVSGQGVAPVALYSRIWLEWLGHRDWQFAVLTAGVLTVARWTDAHLGGGRWSGSATVFLPLVPAPSNYYNRGKEKISEQKLRRWSPSFGLSARREFGPSFGLDAGIQGTYQLFDDTSDTSKAFRVPLSHLEGRLHLQVEFHRPHTDASVIGELGLRSQWGAWGLGTDDPGTRFSRLAGEVSQSLRVGRYGLISLGAAGGMGANLDRFDGFELVAPAGTGPSVWRLVLPVPQVIASRFGGFDVAGEATLRRKLRLGVEGAWLAADDADLLADGRSRPGLTRRFASAGVTAGFNFLWASQASIRAGWSFELGDGAPPRPPAISFSSSRSCAEVELKASDANGRERRERTPKKRGTGLARTQLRWVCARGTTSLGPSPPIAGTCGSTAAATSSASWRLY
jgi:hypothetical protein